ncbi:MAG: GNAT family N-acetyltransferase [Anaerolineales bacterium]|nr:GNAT family N-acetyltransferase [Anaerolineales bacterium]
MGHDAADKGIGSERAGKMNEAAIRILGPDDEAALEMFLQPRLESSLFLLGNMRLAGLADHGRPYQGTYAAAFVDGAIAGVAALFWNGMLVLQATKHLDACWRTAVAQAKRPLQGLIGPAAQVQAVKESLALAAAAIRMDEVEYLYSLKLDDMIVPEKLQMGVWQGRRAASEDLEQQTAWRVAYMMEEMNEADTTELWQRARQSVQHAINADRLWLLQVDGRVVASSGFNAAVAEAVQVGGVYTPPEWRRRGYGRAVVAASLLDARAEGVPTGILFTGVDNVPAQKAYEALGFRRIGDYRILYLHEPLQL